jgi:hypothetical protein
MAAARQRGEGELAVWLAGVTGAGRPVVGVRGVDASSVLPRSPAPDRDEAGAEQALTVAEVAAAVDAGRDVAVAAAAEGITVLVASAPAANDPTPALSLIATLARRDRGARLGFKRACTPSCSPSSAPRSSSR